MAAALGPLAPWMRSGGSGMSRALAGCSCATTMQQIQSAWPASRRRPNQTAAAATAAATTTTSSTLRPSLARAFSTTAVLEKRRYKPRDNNRLRGVSSMRRSGPREFLSVSNWPLPQPATREPIAALDEAELTDPDHGLWGFFYDKKVAPTPKEDAAYGRAWTVEELRRKSWEDLHKLWWVCVKERNRVSTARAARKVYELGFGDAEGDQRDAAVRQTMKGIKHVLTERFYTWEDAVQLAETDPEINLSGEGAAFQPSAFLEQDSVEGSRAEAEAAAPATVSSR